MTEKSKSLDLLGIQPLSKAVETGIEKTFLGVESFLKLVCVPALEEIGLLFKDQIRSWRISNIFRIMEKAKGKIICNDENLTIHANPRVALSIIENGSMTDSDDLQEMWAGLFASSCSNDGADDQNLIFVDLLKQLTSLQVAILNYGCTKCRKIEFKNELIQAEQVNLIVEELMNVIKNNDIHRIDRELDYLRSLELIGWGQGYGGIDPDTDPLSADITPTALALNLFVRAQGHLGSVKSYWKNDVITKEEYDKIRQNENEQKQNSVG
jgi:hypothetical protein